MKGFSAIGFSCLLMGFSSISSAEWTWSPRFEVFQSERSANQRFLFKNTLNLERSSMRFFVESYFESNGASSFMAQTRSPTRGYLQEAYLEFNFGSYFLKVGRQAVRWSDMWAVPSLDFFTGRRWNRGFLDPLTEQLTHPTGLLFSYSHNPWSLDVFSLWQGAESIYPQSFPAQTTAKSDAMEGGLRGRFDWRGHQFQGVFASMEKSQMYGLGWSYAFETVVPKIEVGQRVWEPSSLRSYEPLEVDFASAGLDLFWGQWLLTPQWTLSYDDWNDRVTNLYYGNVSWISDHYEFSLQGSLYDPLLGQFVNVSATYKPNSLWLVQAFWQNYDGSFDSIYGVYRELFGTSVFGLRTQLDFEVIR